MAVDETQLKYLPSHEWAGIVDGVATVGISSFAVNQLSDLTYVELPAVGTKVSTGDQFGEVESVKAASELYSPVTGEVIEVNSELEEDVAPLSSDPFGAGWLIKVRVDESVSGEELMDWAGYKAHCDMADH